MVTPSELLCSLLADGPLPVSVVQDRAREAGLLRPGELIKNSYAFRNAKVELGIRPIKAGLKDGWVWGLPVPEVYFEPDLNDPDDLRDGQLTVSYDLKPDTDHADIRARALSGEIRELVTSSKYPLVNPEAILVERHQVRRYDPETGDYAVVSGTPRTWLSDTLKVAAVAKSGDRKFIFTGAQNDAPIHQGFWQNLHAYADHVGAEIVVGPWTYETRWWAENNPNSREYAAELSDYLCFGQMEIGQNFVFCGEMNTLPTAARPISDLVTYSRGRHAVFPHAKIQLKSVPSTDPAVQAHQVMTSGAITIPKVIPRKAGVKSIFHHIIGATIVEFDHDGDLFCRQLNATDDGSFYDLDRFVSRGQVTTGHRLKAMAIGDLHFDKLGPVNGKAIFGVDPRNPEAGVLYPNNIIDTLKPENIFLHDVLDNQSRNHHHVNDPQYAYEMAYRKRDDVFEEVRRCATFLEHNKRDDTNFVVVESNHDIALDRYVREGRYRGDGVNHRFGLACDDALSEYRERIGAALEQYREPPHFSLLEWSCRKIKGTRLDHVKWTYDGGSYLVDGVEYGHHGFRGANGSRGSVTGFARIGRKMSIADKHTPEIMDAVFVAGALELQHGYNRGPSGWAVAHILQYQNGKRSLLTMQRGKWRA